MNKREIEMCIRILKRAVDYPNEESLKFVIEYLEEDFVRKNRKFGKKIEEKKKVKMQMARTKLGLNTNIKTIEKWNKKSEKLLEG